MRRQSTPRYSALQAWAFRPTSSLPRGAAKVPLNEWIAYLASHDPPDHALPRTSVGLDVRPYAQCITLHRKTLKVCAPMNYRHAFHAGGFGHVFKHIVLSLVIGHLRAKPAAFRIVDTHAGAGLYDLTGPEASRTGGWRVGIGRLLVARWHCRCESSSPLIWPRSSASIPVNNL
jgi:hypothetical protein